MLSNLLKGKDKNTVIDNIDNKDILLYNEIVDMVSIGNIEIIEICINSGLFKDISSITTLIDTLTYKNIKIDDADKFIELIKNNTIKNSINWLYYYGRAIQHNIEIAESILKHKLVKIDAKDYGIIRMYIVKKDLSKLKEIINSYDINIWADDETLPKLVVGSYLYFKDGFNYLMSLNDINKNKIAINTIVNSFDAVKLFKYLFNRKHLSDDKLDVYYTIRCALISYKTNVVDYLTNERGLIPKGDLSELEEISNEIGYKKGSFEKLGL